LYLLTFPGLIFKKTFKNSLKGIKKSYWQVKKKKMKNFGDENFYGTWDKKKIKMSKSFQYFESLKETNKLISSNRYASLFVQDEEETNKKIDYENYMVDFESIFKVKELGEAFKRFLEFGKKKNKKKKEIRSRWNL
jgi:hypothetical protein